jgi:hypothetical protein
MKTNIKRTMRKTLILGFYLYGNIILPINFDIIINPNLSKNIILIMNYKKKRNYVTPYVRCYLHNRFMYLHCYVNIKKF